MNVMNEVKYLWIKTYADWFVSRFMFMDYDVACFLASLAALESMFGNSTIARENNNLVGMKVPKNRLSTCVSENRNHAVYSTVYSSLIDLMFWFQSHGFNQSDFARFDKFMKSKTWFSVYCPNPDYFERINSIFKKFKSYKNE